MSMYFRSKSALRAFGLTIGNRFDAPEGNQDGWGTSIKSCDPLKAKTLRVSAFSIKHDV
ncbi:hypothetical protein ACU8KH_04870 [Lachancea thermotolerans]